MMVQQDWAVLAMLSLAHIGWTFNSRSHETKARIGLNPDSLASIDIKSLFIGTLRGVDLRQHPRPI